MERLEKSALSPACSPLSFDNSLVLGIFRIWCLMLSLIKSKDSLFRWGLFLFLILFTLVTHQEENTRTLLEFQIWRILTIAFFVIKKGDNSSFLFGSLILVGSKSHVCCWLELGIYQPDCWTYLGSV